MYRPGPSRLTTLILPLWPAEEMLTAGFRTLRNRCCPREFMLVNPTQGRTITAMYRDADCVVQASGLGV